MFCFTLGGDTPLRLLRPYRPIVHHDNAYFGVFYKRCFVLPWGATPPFDFSDPIHPSFITTMRISVFSIRNVLFYPGGRHPPSTSHTLSAHRSSRQCVFRCFLKELFFEPRGASSLRQLSSRHLSPNS